jgi:hypothetical protein
MEIQSKNTITLTNTQLYKILQQVLGLPSGDRNIVSMRITLGCNESTFMGTDSLTISYNTTKKIDPTPVSYAAWPTTSSSQFDDRDQNDR